MSIKHILAVVGSTGFATPATKLVLLALADCCHADGSNARPSLEYLARRSASCRGTVRACLSTLVRMGLISEQAKAIGRRAATWRLNLDAIARLADKTKGGARPSRGTTMAPLAGQQDGRRGTTIGPLAGPQDGRRRTNPRSLARPVVVEFPPVEVQRLDPILRTTYGGTDNGRSATPDGQRGEPSPLTPRRAEMPRYVLVSSTESKSA